MIASTRYRAADLFCGAGGMTLGAEQSGRIDVVLAVNHWRTAIFTHERNHPTTRHICARIEDMNLRDEHDLPELDMIMGGIECTHHSNARGAAPINDQRRTSAWRVLDSQRAFYTWLMYGGPHQIPLTEDAFVACTAMAAKRRKPTEERQ